MAFSGWQHGNLLNRSNLSDYLHLKMCNLVLWCSSILSPSSLTRDILKALILYFLLGHPYFQYRNRCNLIVLEMNWSENKCLHKRRLVRSVAPPYNLSRVLSSPTNAHLCLTSLPFSQSQLFSLTLSLTKGHTWLNQEMDPLTGRFPLQLSF